MCFMTFDMFCNNIFYIFNECRSKFGFDLFRIQKIFEYQFGDQIFFSCFTRIFHPRVYPFLQIITYSIIKYPIEAGKQYFFIIWWVQPILTRWKPHLIRNAFLKTFSPGISICINSWRQPSLITVFTFDKIYDGNNVGLVLQLKISIKKKPKLFHLVKRPSES